MLASCEEVLQIASAILKVTQRIVRGTLSSVTVIVEPWFTSRFAMYMCILLYYLFFFVMNQ
jgi:hypothetical protein